jgi:hypothetical protein
MAGLTTTQTFSDGDTVTAAKLNNIVSNCSIDADAVTTAKILNANVTLAKMATNSVDTGQLVADSVQNSKLNDMAAKTVKANATNGAANPTDVAVAANKLLAGTSNSINAVSFADDLELDASDSAATKIIAAASLIGGKASVTADELDEILIKDATDGALKRATVQTAVQSQVASTGSSGVSRLATDAMTQNPMGSSGEADYEVQRINNAAKNPMLIKAFGAFTVAAGPGFAVTTTDTYNIASIARTGVGTFTVTMTNGMPGTKYHLIGDGFYETSQAGGGMQGYISGKTSGTVFELKTIETHESPSAADPLGGFTFMVFGLGTS